MTTLTFPVKFFGMFRKFGEHLDIEIPAGCSVLQIKDKIALHLGEEHKDLVKSSVLANQTDILPDSYLFQEAQSLSILPPVCGG